MTMTDHIAPIAGTHSRILDPITAPDAVMPPLSECALLLDIDGTLLDMAPTPREVWVPPELATALGRLLQLTNGALEASNVDLSKELVNMIVAQRNYQSNAQTIKTQDQILNTLVNLR